MKAVKNNAIFKKYLRRGLAVAMAFSAGLLIALCVGASTSSDDNSALTLIKSELGGLSGQGDGFTTLMNMMLGESAYLPFALAVDVPSVSPSVDPTPVPEVTPTPTTPLPDAQPAPDHDDITEEPVSTAAPEDIVARTLTPSSSLGYDVAGGLYLYNQTDLTIDLEAVTQSEVDITLGDNASPQVLIIHTHGTEAYTPDGTDIYEPSDTNTRTTEEDYNILRVGDEVERIFTEMGLSVLHDRALYDYPQYINSYARSALSVAEYLEEYPSIKIVLDIHRDALIGEDGTVYKAVTEIDGTTAAQVMLVLGSGETHPDWMENLTLATKIQQSMNTLYPTLARPMVLRTSTYNQQLSTGSILVEIGCHGNTLEEALAGAQYFARATGQVLLSLTE